ncbi:hypothetical protein JCM19235_7009 [Vibrio maritimus]|uniref:Uncharacterized protein n=1 Tax=Vibrio maritimus TaxID=990268 RepID=A0A090S977_9VIBR|nr:hypothetical protein JCM19235_7009 [Vibrio maritimus]
MSFYSNVKLKAVFTCIALLTSGCSSAYQVESMMQKYTWSTISNVVTVHRR